MCAVRAWMHDATGLTKRLNFAAELFRDASRGSSLPIKPYTLVSTHLNVALEICQNHASECKLTLSEKHSKFKYLLVCGC